MRYIKQLIEKIHLLLLRLKNPSYISYYRAVMDYRAKKDPKQAIGGKWDEMGVHQLDFLKLHGLQPTHTLLDIGCGSLRGGLHFIEYLNTGNYTGMEISSELLRVGKTFLKDKNLEKKLPNLLLTTDLKFNEFEKKFDYLNAQSVLSHMPVEDITEMFKNLHKIMHERSIFIATYKEVKEGKDGYHSSVSELNFHYPLEQLQSIAKEYGFDAEKIQDEKIQRTQSILKIRKVR